MFYTRSDDRNTEAHIHIILLRGWPTPVPEEGALTDFISKNVGGW